MFLEYFRYLLLAATVLGTTRTEKAIPVDPVNAPDSTSVTLLFAGDIMQHGPQIEAAWDVTDSAYDYDPCFSYVKPIITAYDIAIANLEVTLAGKPFTGYPQFSAPDELAVAARNAGFDVLATANNHSCDRGKAGVIRTTRVLDSLGILR
ncbi:MAG: CapA family protein, partial [Lentimicrobium sp.]|nr:CapA family protein [Lentimicrobium sp.]